MSNVLITLEGRFLEKIFEGNFTDIYLFQITIGSVPITISVRKSEQVILKQSLKIEVSLFGRYNVLSNGEKKYTNCFRMVGQNKIISEEDAQANNHNENEGTKETKEQEVELQIRQIINRGNNLRKRRNRIKK